MGNLELISVNIPHILITIVNLLILFLLIKKFLFKPVQRILDARKAEVDKVYADAADAQEAADRDKALYAEKLENAEAEADALLKNAAKKAEQNSDVVLAEATEKASAMLKKAEAEIAQERKKAVNEIKNEISDISVSIAGKVIEREINADDHKTLIDGFIEELDA
ncbi:MAG: F0F1 ATP synthase subunit B [Clostridia bacterium]|nr:F0F1 ATP synthase subunit B [Clostridia bacterium]